MYIIERFGDAWASATVLPTLDGRQPLGIRGIEGSILRLPGGRAYDWRGSERAPIAPEEIVIEGVWVADSVAAMETKHAALLALVGRRSKLWRSNGTTQHWRTARLLSIDAPVEAGFAHWMAYTMRFELAAMPWQGTAQSPNAALDTSPKVVACANSGNARVTNPVVTVTAAGSTITVVRVRVVGVSDIQWSGSLAAGQSLVIDCGKRTVRRAGADAYAGFSLLAGHVVSDWLRIEPGVTAVQIYRTGGSAASTATVAYNEGWL
jgi:hypothetical protein